MISRVPELVHKLFPSFTWKINGEGKVVYVTFDDGPTPEVTPWVLEKLEIYNAKATFFCLGKNVEADNELYASILEAGHVTGNHSYSHIKGYSASIQKYVDNVEKASEFISSELFRPPYGRIRTRQARALARTYKIILWSVLSVDYENSLSPERVARNVTKNVKPGSIIVFHDSLKASKNLIGALPLVLEFLKESGYEMKAITSSDQ